MDDLDSSSIDELHILKAHHKSQQRIWTLVSSPQRRSILRRSGIRRTQRRSSQNQEFRVLICSSLCYLTRAMEMHMSLGSPFSSAMVDDDKCDQLNYILIYSSHNILLKLN